MSKNILIFSDGSGQRGGILFDENRSNIYKGLVTLLNQVREKPALPKVSNCRDCLAPRAHRHGAKRAMRLS